MELLPASFQGPPQMGVTFLGPFFSSCFSVSSASSKRVLKKTYFYRVCFAHPSNASSNIMQQQSNKA